MHATVAISLAILAAAPAGATTGQLLVFNGPARSEVAREFRSQIVPRLKTLAGELDVEFRFMEHSHGVPASVTVTPLIMFQNHLGRSVYQGRYLDLERIRTFVRTAQRVAQGDDATTRQDVPVWAFGRARIATPLKITLLSGEVPEGFDPAEFEGRARAAIIRGFKRLEVAEVVSLRRSDRLFYMDFYPWRSSDGKIAVAVSLFSQFNCKVPIFEQDGAAASGLWVERDAVFARAAAALEQAMVDQMGSTVHGDGFDVVSTDVKIATWEELGLRLPDEPADAPAEMTGLPLARVWRVLDDDLEYLPVLQFRFAPPLDSYAGEVFRVNGGLTLANGFETDTIRGAFNADPKSVTMGEPLLDKTLQGEVFLHTEQYPSSRFSIDTVEGDGHVRWGRKAAVRMAGRFQLKGVTVPLTMDATLEPTVGGVGGVLLNFKGRFDLDIRPFELEGPDGPQPATHTMRFDFDLFLEPDEDGVAPTP